MAWFKGAHNSSTPPTPASGSSALYFDGSGNLKTIDDQGNVHTVEFVLTTSAMFALEYSSGTAGDTLTANAWNTIKLNTTDYNHITSASLNTSTGIFTLPAGTYNVFGWAYALRNIDDGQYASLVKSRVYISSTTTTVLNGISAMSDSYSMGVTVVAGEITLSQSADLAFQLRTSSGGINGRPNSTGLNERYSFVRITKLS